MQDLDLSSFFHTKTESDDFLIRVQNLSDKLYETNFNLEKALIDTLGIEKKDKFIALLRNNNINSASPSDMKIFLDKLQDAITKLPVLSLSLAFEPKEETLRLLDEWFELNLKKQFVFDIAVNTQLIAGTAINFNGKYLNCSIKAAFDKIMQDVVAKEAKNPPVVIHLAPNA